MSITKIPASDPAVPNTVSKQSASDPAVPNTVSKQSASDPAVPNTVSKQSASDPAVPNTVSKQSASDPAVPNTVSKQSASDPAVPNTVSRVTAAGFPRTTEPRINLDFGDNLYELNSVAKSLTDIITYSRASSATYVERYQDQFGKYSYRLVEDFVGSVENLVTFSEQFDESDWTTNNLSVTANQITNPVTNSRVADKLTDDDTNDTHYIAASTSTVTSGATVNVSVRAKAGTLSKIGLYETQSADGVLFDLNSGAAVAETGTPDTSSMKYLSDGWYELSVTVTVPSTSAAFRIYLDSFSAYVGDESYLYVVGAQLTESVKPLPYVKTLSSPVTETFTESPRLEYDAATGDALGYLAEGASTNLITYSEQLDDADWTKSDVTINDNSAVAPDGTKSADKILDSASNVTHAVRQNKSNTGENTRSISVYAKAAERQYLILGDNNQADGFAFFDLYAGTVGTVQSNVISTNITDARNGWYRCAVTVSNPSTLVALFGVSNADGTEAYSGDGLSGIFLWGAQVEELPFATSYIRTESSTVSRSADFMTVDNSLLPNLLSSHSFYASFSLFGFSDFAKIYRVSGESSDNYYSQIRSSTERLQTVVEGYSTTTSDDTLILNQNFELVVTFSNSKLSAYLDGTLFDTDESKTGFQVDVSDVIGIGNSVTSAQELFGHIKQLAVYDVALTAQEVSLL